MKNLLTLFFLFGFIFFNYSIPKYNLESIDNKSISCSGKSVFDTLRITEDLKESRVFIKMYKASISGIDGNKCDNKVILSFSNLEVKGYGVDCGNEYGIYNYYSGKFKGLSIYGDLSGFDNCGGDSDAPMCMNNDKFTINISRDTSVIIINGNKYTQTIFPVKMKELKLYESPSKFSNQKNIKNLNSKIELLEIGSIEKSGEYWFVWCKIKIEGIIVWSLNEIVI